VIRFPATYRWFLALTLCGACTVALAQQDDSYLRSEFDRVWAEYKQNARAENHEAALRFARRGYELGQEVLTEEKALFADVSAQYGSALLLAGNIDESLPILEQSLKNIAAAYGKKSYEQVPVLMSLASANGATQSEWKQRRFLSRAKKLVVAKFGEDSIGYADFALDSGILISNYFLSTTARDYLEDARKIYARRLPPDHPSVGTAVYYLAYFQLRDGSVLKAIDLFAKAADILPTDTAELVSLKSSALRQLGCIKYTNYMRVDKDEIRERTDVLEGATQSNWPLPIKRVAPVYPASALYAGVLGYVDFSFTVNEDGRPQDIEIIYACGGDYFDETAMFAVKQFEYERTFVDGVAVAVDGVRSRIYYDIDR